MRSKLHLLIMFRAILLYSILVFTACSTKKYSEIFVSPTGDDQASGKQTEPVESLQRAAELARTKAGKESVIIWMSGGTYQLRNPLELNVKDSGTFDAPVLWKAFPGEKPVISGGIEIRNWQEEEDGFWSAPLPEEIRGSFRSLYVNGRRAVRARFPDEGFLRIRKAGEDNRTNFFFNDKDFPELKEVKNLELILLHDWSISRLGVKSIDWETHHLYAIDSIGARSPSFFTLTNWEKQPRYYLENAIEFLDNPGEWYGDFSRNRIYYSPMPNEKITEIEAFLPLVPKLVTITGDKVKGEYAGFISFGGITFEHTAWPIPERGYCGIQACMFDNRENNGGGWEKVSAAIELDFAEKL